MLIQEQATQPRVGFIEFTRAAFEQSLVDRFEEQVERYPNRLAIKVGQTALSFAELNAWANRVAHAILERRDGHPAPVVLLLEDTVALVAAMLGTLKAGDFYVVLDPSDPAARIRILVEDARAALIVCGHSSRELAVELGSRLSLLDLDDLEESAAPNTPNPGLPSSPDAFVYIMYTSGATGRPKGVLQTHRNLLHAVYSTTNRLQHSADDRMGVLPPLGMGVGAVMLFSGLLIGAAAFPFNVRRHGVARMAEWLVEERITSSYSLPSVIRNAFQLLPPGRRLPDLRVVKMGGEPFFRSDLPLLRDHLMPGSIVQLTLGSTETYSVAWSFVDLWSEPATSVLPVGRPDEDREVVLVNEEAQPVEPGEVGEIIVRSQFLSPGYWRQPEVTQAKFRQGPDGKRDFQSGDLGRVLPDGKLLHLGRKDFVAKIRGHLVAPTEVETALRDLDGVSDAAVVARTESARTRLVAYVVAGDVGGRVPQRALRDGLAAMLPAYMVPAEYVFIDRLPLLPNGKVDIARLPSANAERSRPYQPPRTPAESLLAGIWSEVLGRQVGVDDDFLELGGDSLLSAQTLARINTACQVELPFSAMFETPTVAALARILTEHLARGIDEARLAAMLDELEMMPESEAERELQGTPRE